VNKNNARYQIAITSLSTVEGFPFSFSDGVDCRQISNHSMSRKLQPGEFLFSQKLNPKEKSGIW
jgi:hypothetical protein